MRVVESKPVVTQTMGKRKHKLRKQSKENKLCPGSDSSDEAGLQGATAVQGCSHINKSINFSLVKKAIKQQASTGECTTCTRESTGSKNEGRSITPPPPQGAAPLAEEESLLDAAEQTIWVCLQCGHQGCDRFSKEKHALKHYQTPRSTSHALAVNINTWSIWCYTCDDEVFVDNSKKLVECVEFLRKQCGMGRPDSAAGRPSSRTENPVQDSIETSGTSREEKPKLQQQKSLKYNAQLSPGIVLPKVKGLSNLGNTCFFNAVMQNLSQTPGLEGMILDQSKKHMTMTIPAATVMDSDTDSLSNEEEEEEEEEEAKKYTDRNGETSQNDKLHLEPLEINLSESGALTQSLLSFLTDMNNPAKNSVISPSSLFGQVCRKAPRFKGFQQQDSHELLRHLLDGMKAEEVKRRQKGILKSFGLPENPNPRKIDDITKKKIKEYGRLVKHTFVDSVFGGCFISTVLCEECKHPSQIFEPFLDISLPITEEKPLRPNSIWGSRKKVEGAKSSISTTLTASKSATDGFTADKPSKHMTKKAKKLARKEKKTRRGKSVVDSSKASVEKNKSAEREEKEDEPAEPSALLSGGRKTGNADSHSNNDEEWDSKSDADIEDNIESDVIKKQSRSKASEGIAKSVSEENNPVHKISDSKMTLVNGLAFSAHHCVVMETRLERSSKSDSELCTQGTSGAKRSDSAIDVDSLTTSISSMGISNDTSTLRSISNEDLVKRQDVMVNGVSDHLDAAVDCSRDFNTDDAGDSQRKKKAAETVEVKNIDALEESSHKDDCVGVGKANAQGADANNLPKNSTKSRSELRLQVKVKATSTLVPRYQAVGHECSILSCLNQFTAMELLTGNNKFGCEKCTFRKYGKQTGDGKKEVVYTNASKQVLIFCPPPILTLHLKRFQQVGFSLRKVNRHVDFPLILDLAPFCSSMARGLKQEQTQVLYSLYGVVEHSGRLNSGHYTAYVKVRPKSERILQHINNGGMKGMKLNKILEAMATSSVDSKDDEEKKETLEGGTEEGATGGVGTTEQQQDEIKEEPAVKNPTLLERQNSVTGNSNSPATSPGRWFYISDSRVNEVSESAVLKCQAYMLFYERIF